MKHEICNEMRPFDRALVALYPVLSRIIPNPTPGQCPEISPHPSAMLSEHNWFHRLIFLRPFKMVNADKNSIAELKQESERSTIVYVMKTTGQFEYNYFNELFLKENLPLAAYTNTLTCRRWMKWNAFRNSLRRSIAEIETNGRPADPLDDNLLPQMIADGKSILIMLPPSGLIDDGLYFTGPARILTALVEASKLSQRPISVVPLEFLWSRRPAKAKPSAFDVMFGEKENPGALRRFVLFWRNYMTRAEVSIGAPIDLASFIQWEGGDSSRVASRLRGFLIGALGAQRRTMTGPPARPRRWFVGQVTGDESFDNALCRIAAEKGKPADDLRDMAASYAHEIAADIDYSYLEIADRILKWGLRRIYESVRIDTEGLKLAKELYAEGAVVFVPNHKSHVDYLVLSHALYHNGMTVPHIAAGINLSFWPIGNIFRRCGAFFIRRTFRGNPVYRATLETYLKILLKEGYSLEFFIEGGRSRTGKLLQPKLGMLSMLHAAARNANIKNLHFIPVSITYDRVIEQKSYTSEQEGASKKEERSSQLLKLTKYLRRRKQSYGSIYINFGRPVQAAQNVDAKAEIESVAQKICREINRRAVATPTAIAAAALLAPAMQGVRVEEVRKNFNAIISYLEAKGAAISDRIRQNPDTVFDEAISKLSHTKLVQPHQNSVEPFYAIPEDKRIGLAYFKNSIVHFLATIGVVSRILAKARKEGRQISIEDISRDFEISKRLLAHEFRFGAQRDAREHIGAALDFLTSKGALQRAENSCVSLTEDDQKICNLFAAQIRPFLETLWIAARYASERLKGAAEKRAIVSEMMQAGHDLFLLGQVRCREAMTKAGFENALDALCSYGAISREEREQGKKRVYVYLPAADTSGIQTLKAELERLF